jgi:hypothetical protein
LFHGWDDNSLYNYKGFKIMMEDKDLLEYENIGKAIKHSDKYTYVDATRHEDQGTRLYDVNGSRLPSVTTILGRTKDQQFLKEWKAKVGEARSRANQERI